MDVNLLNTFMFSLMVAFGLLAGGSLFFVLSGACFWVFDKVEFLWTSYQYRKQRAHR